MLTWEIYVVLVEANTDENRGDLEVALADYSVELCATAHPELCAAFRIPAESAGHAALEAERLIADKFDSRVVAIEVAAAGYGLANEL